jgi:nucleotide-binding universal stress UspA family protein
MFTHILIPTDGSGLSRKAIAGGIALAKVAGAKVTAVFAAPTATPVVYRRTAAHYLGVVEKAAKKARVRCETVCVTNDFPAEAILAVAKKGKCDLIFMASHGRRGISGLLVGSETQKVLAHARIPVLVYR